MKHSRKRVAARSRAVGGSSPLNVTQAAGQKRRDGEKIQVDDVAGYHCQA